MSLRDSVTAVTDWYTEQTARSAPPSRILNIMLAIESLSGDLPFRRPYLDQLELVISTDPKWNERRNRSEKEKHGMLIGTGKSKEGRPEFWYLVPKKGDSSHG